MDIQNQPINNKDDMIKFLRDHAERKKQKVEESKNVEALDMASSARRRLSSKKDEVKLTRIETKESVEVQLFRQNSNKEASKETPRRLSTQPSTSAATKPTSLNSTAQKPILATSAPYPKPKISISKASPTTDSGPKVVVSRTTTSTSRTLVTSVKK